MSPDADSSSAAEARRVLVIGPAWVGDMVMAQSLFSLLRDGGATVDVLAPPATAPLLDRMPEVRNAIVAPFAHGRLDLRSRVRLARSIRRARYDRAIVLPRSLKAAIIPFLAGVPRRTGFLGESRYWLINDVRPLDEEALPRTVERYVALGASTAAAAPPRPRPPRLTVDPENQRRLLERFGLSQERPIVGFMPGAEYGPAKRWPPEYFGALARALADGGYRVCLFGSPRDTEVCAEIARHAGPAVADLSGRTSLPDAVDLIAATAFCVTNDSGLMHVAAATDRPLVAVFGSSSPDVTPPLSDRAEIVYLRLPCSPCFDRECRFGHYACLREISVDDVRRRVESLLAAGRETGREWAR